MVYFVELVIAILARFIFKILCYCFPKVKQYFLRNNQWPDIWHATTFDGFLNVVMLKVIGVFLLLLFFCFYFYVTFIDQHYWFEVKLFICLPLFLIVGFLFKYEKRFYIKKF